MYHLTLIDITSTCGLHHFLDSVGIVGSIIHQDLRTFRLCSPSGFGRYLGIAVFSIHDVKYRRVNFPWSCDITRLERSYLDCKDWLFPYMSAIFPIPNEWEAWKALSGFEPAPCSLTSLPFSLKANEWMKNEYCPSLLAAFQNSSYHNIKTSFLPMELSRTHGEVRRKFYDFFRFPFSTALSIHTVFQCR